MERRAALAVVLLMDGTRLRQVNGSSLEVSPVVVASQRRPRAHAAVMLTNSGSAPLTLTTRLEGDARGSFSLGEAPARLEADRDRVEHAGESAGQK